MNEHETHIYLSNQRCAFLAALSLDQTKARMLPMTEWHTAETHWWFAGGRLCVYGKGCL